MHYNSVLGLGKEVLGHGKADHAPSIANVKIAFARDVRKGGALTPLQRISNFLCMYEMQRHHASTSLCSVHDMADRSAEKIVQFVRSFSSILPCIFDFWW
jgi:hypothetical protein